jgi:hypothetical protein
MRIAGRLALQSAGEEQGVPIAVQGLASAIMGYHGCDVVVRNLCERQFEADLVAKLPKGALVRLRLPGAGMMVARVTSSHRGTLKASFVNPVSPARLGKTLGWAAPLVVAA